jgi:peroxidase
MAHFWSRWIGREQTSQPKKRKRDSLRRRPQPENLESRQLLAANIFHNETTPEDVDEDGIISTLDALTVMNQIRRQSANGQGRDGGGEQRGRGRMTDVNNDG